MKRIVGYVLLGLVAYAVFMVLEAPAAAVFDRVSRQMPGVSARQVTGSALWGTAEGVTFGTAGLESVAWRPSLWPLLAGRLGVHIAVTDRELELAGLAAMGLDRQMAISDLSGRLPLPKAVALLGRPPPPLLGELDLNGVAAHFDLNRRLQAAFGTITLRGTRTSFGRPLELGDYTADLNTTDQGIVAVIRDGGGPLEVTGTLTLTPEGRYRFNGQVAVRDAGNRELRQVLGMLGQPGRDGKWTLDLSGVLTL
jgi:general secretion pathway protein N